jgi:hypothetical protein
VNLTLVGVQQDARATAAGVIGGVLTRHEHGRSIQNDADRGGGDYVKSHLTTGHDALPLQAGVLQNSQPPTPIYFVMPVMIENKPL